MAEIRAAYVELARRNHPDLHTGDETARRGAEQRMREINGAWAGLGTVEARSTYDRQRFDARARSQPRHAAGFDPGEWVPYESDPAPGFDERDDRPITSGGLPPWLSLAPPLLFAAGVVGFVIGGLVGLVPIIALAALSVLLSASLFLVAPLVVMAASRREDSEA